jgi:hypothetical protein
MPSGFRLQGAKREASNRMLELKIGKVHMSGESLIVIRLWLVAERRHGRMRFGWGRRFAKRPAEVALRRRRGLSGRP